MAENAFNAKPGIPEIQLHTHESLSLDSAEDAPVPAGGSDHSNWASKIGYLLTLVGYAVGFGNIWRFPYLLHSNGGIAFLVPYTVMVMLAGIPIFFLELAVGQRFRKGALGSWNEINPYLGGLGIACGLICLFVVFYYNTLVAWVMFYIGASFSNPLPWSSCTGLSKFRLQDEEMVKIDNQTSVPKECLVSNQPAKYYWFRRVLDISEDIDQSAEFNYVLFIVLTLGWISIAAILSKGVKSSEKVVFFTALFPYAVLLIFFFVNFFQPGFSYGYRFLFAPDWDMMYSAEVWLKAGSQIFFSLGVAYGCLIAFSSHLPANNDCYKDAVQVTIINCATSLFAAVVLFPIFGYLGKGKFDGCLDNRKFEALVALGIYPRTDVFNLDNLVGFKDYKIESQTDTEFENKGWILKVLDTKNNIQLNKLPLYLDPDMYLDCDMEKFVRSGGSGTGLVFIGFAEAVQRLPFPPIWSFLFFVMLLTLGIDSSFGTLEGAIAVFEDMKIVRRPRWVIVCGWAFVLWLASIVFAFGWGMYVLDLLDQFVANWSLLIIGLCETIAVAWVYGLAKFAYDIKLMTGRRPNLFIMICWKFVTPALILLILIMTVVQQFKEGYGYSRYNIEKGDLETKLHSRGYIAFNYIIFIMVVIWVPLQAILKFFGKSLLREETPRYFPEDELKAENNLGDPEEEEYSRLDQLVMGKSIQDFKEERKPSNTRLEDGERKSVVSLHTPHDSTNPSQTSTAAKSHGVGESDE